MRISSIILYFTAHTCILPTLATSANSSHPSTGSCKLRNEWRKRIAPSSFKPTYDCWGLNKILAAVNKNRTRNFCAADPDVVFKYINSSLWTLSHGQQPKPCEVREWYYGNYGGKMKRPFCENATAINRLLAAHSHDPTQRYDNTPARTQPYLSVFHGARNECNQKFKSELKSIGDPDLAGVGVLTSQFIGMFLLMVFHVAALWPESIPLATCFLKSIRHFYVTATVLGFSITSAALATFLLHRSASDSLHDNFGYVNFYLNSMLALAPPLYAMPAVVLALMPPEALDKRSQSGKQIKLWDEAVVLPLMPPETPNKRNQWVKRMKLWDKEKHGSVEFHWAQLNAVILYTCCIVVMWIIWSRGVRDQHNPTLIVFGTRLNVKVSHFLYDHASTYVLSVCILMSALPIAGLAALTTLMVWHAIRKTEVTQRSRSLFFLRDRCRDICILFGISQLGMFTYIRGQAIHQANGSTPEMNWGFGQILIVFTWVPLLLSIGSEIKSAF